MSTQAPRTCPATGRTPGFTLIEVIGALVIFSVGVLMVMQVSGALGIQMRNAGARSEIAVLANARLDSIGSIPFASLTNGASQDTVMVQGWAYRRMVTITPITPILARVDVSLSPLDSVGPSHAVTGYTSAAW